MNNRRQEHTPPHPQSDDGVAGAGKNGFARVALAAFVSPGALLLLSGAVGVVRRGVEVAAGPALLGRNGLPRDGGGVAADAAEAVVWALPAVAAEVGVRVGVGEKTGAVRLAAAGWWRSEGGADVGAAVVMVVAVVRGVVAALPAALAL